MNVRELIKVLERYDPEATVHMKMWDNPREEVEAVRPCFEDPCTCEQDTMGCRQHAFAYRHLRCPMIAVETVEIMEDPE